MMAFVSGEGSTRIIYHHTSYFTIHNHYLQLFLIFVPCIFFMFMKNQQMHWSFSSLLFYSAAPTCFDTCVSSSGSSSVPAEIHMNRMQWLIRLWVIRCYVSVMWRPGVHQSVRCVRSVCVETCRSGRIN
jgi:hypothetical protein